MKRMVGLNSGDSNSINFQPVFLMLNDELSKAGESLELTCAGGYAMQMNGYRGTADVDAFYQSNATIDRIIRKVGDAFGINRPDEPWLNNSISNMKDLAEIIKHNEDLQPLSLLSKLSEMGFDIDISILIDAFEEARGMEWLDAYYKENEQEICMYF